MVGKFSQDTENPREIPEAYKSGFSFFAEDTQEEISGLKVLELASYMSFNPRYSGMYIHELWRTGRLERVYDFFVLPDGCRSYEVREEDVISNIAIMMKCGDVSNAECAAFLFDLCRASQYAHDDLPFGSTVFDKQAVDDRVERLMDKVSTVAKSLPIERCS